MARLFAINKNGCILWAIIAMLIFAPFYVYGAGESANQIINIAKIDGTGVVKIRRAKGTEVVAMAGEKLLPGDKITTDSDSMADLILHDGTMVRIGYNTDYKIEAIEEEKPGLWSWAFGMANGSIRALVEKSKEKGFVKFKVSTPSGTMGVRGTEILLTEKNGSLELNTLHGEALLGPANASFKNISLFQSVGAGMRSIIIRGERKSRVPERFTLRDLIQGRVQNEVTANAAGSSGKADESMAAMLGLKKSANKDSLSDKDSTELLAKAQDDFNKAKESLNVQFATENARNVIGGSADGIAKNSTAEGITKFNPRENTRVTTTSAGMRSVQPNSSSTATKRVDGSGSTYTNVEKNSTPSATKLVQNPIVTTTSLSSETLDALKRSIGQANIEIQNTEANQQIIYDKTYSSEPQHSVAPYVAPVDYTNALTDTAVQEKFSDTPIITASPTDSITPPGAVGTKTITTQTTVGISSGVPICSTGYKYDTTVGKCVLTTTTFQQVLKKLITCADGVQREVCQIYSTPTNKYKSNTSLITNTQQKLNAVKIKK